MAISKWFSFSFLNYMDNKKASNFRGFFYNNLAIKLSSNSFDTRQFLAFHVFQHGAATG